MGAAGCGSGRGARRADAGVAGGVDGGLEGIGVGFAGGVAGSFVLGVSVELLEGVGEILAVGHAVSSVSAGGSARAETSQSQSCTSSPAAFVPGSVSAAQRPELKAWLCAMR